MFHMLLHFLVPAIIASIFFRKRWLFAYLIMMATMLVDLDHLLATPIYDPSRCSIGFHPLHRLAAIVVYILLSMVAKAPYLRYLGLGLVIHMLLDSLDCQVTNGIWYTS